MYNVVKVDNTTLERTTVATGIDSLQKAQDKIRNQRIADEIRGLPVGKEYHYEVEDA